MDPSRYLTLSRVLSSMNWPSPDVTWTTRDIRQRLIEWIGSTHPRPTWRRLVQVLREAGLEEAARSVYEYHGEVLLEF